MLAAAFFLSSSILAKSSLLGPAVGGSAVGSISAEADTGGGRTPNPGIPKFWAGADGPAGLEGKYAGGKGGMTCEDAETCGGGKGGIVTGGTCDGGNGGMVLPGPGWAELGTKSCRGAGALCEEACERAIRRA